MPTAATKPRRYGGWCWLLAGSVFIGASCSSKQPAAPAPDRKAAATARPAPGPSPAQPASPSSPAPRPAEKPPASPPPPAAGAGTGAPPEAELTIVHLADRPGDADAIVMFPDGTTVATSGEDGKIEITKIPSQEVLATFAGFPGAPRLAVSADGKLLAYGTDRDPRVKIWDAAGRRELKTLEGHQLSISDLAFAPQGDRLASASRSAESGAEGEIKIWNLQENSTPIALDPGSGISGVAFSPDGKSLASAGLAKPLEGGAVLAETIVWNLETRQATARVKNEHGHMYRVAFAPDGTTLAIAERSGPRSIQVAHRVRLADPLTGTLKGILLGHLDAIHGLAYSPDGQFLVSAGKDGRLCVWQVPTLSQRSVLDLGGYHHGEVTFSGDGTRLAIAAKRDASAIHPLVLSFEYAVRSESPSPGQAPFSLRVLETPTSVQIDRLAFSADGQKLAASGERAGTWIYDISNWAGRQFPNQPTFRLQALSPDLTRAAVFADTLKLWDLQTGQATHDSADPVLVEGYQAMLDARFSPDGKLLASAHWGAGAPGAIKLRNAQTGQLFAVTYHPEGTPTCLAFSADGTKLISGSRLFRFVQGRFNGMGPVSVWDVKEPQDPQAWRMRSLRRTVRREVSTEAKAAFAKAAGFYKQGGGANSVVKVLQPVASHLAQINVSPDPRDLHWHEVSLNPTGAGCDAVRFKVPGNEPVDLMWTVVWTRPLVDCGLAPVAASASDLTSRVVFLQPTSETPEETGEAVGQICEGPAIQPEQEYIVWFVLNTDRPVDGMVSVNAIPKGTVHAQGWAWPIQEELFKSVPLFRRTRLFCHGGNVAQVAISPDGRFAASVGVDGLLKLWDVASGAVAAKFPSGVAEFSPDGRWLATAGGGEEAVSIILRDPTNGQRVRALTGGHFLGVTALAFSPNGQRLASGGRDGLVTVWNPQTGEQAWTPAEE